ncbi:hypothetical protein N7519_004195 [Penicillium mononematosum]|uniref:uncharacterized protein n=1 Tax=Penicillium mononematosum TaxID=268346 RepID=UPI00254786C4|nr:uncharacterized protein N7519_004195 [Penicillium mononematosum]KAJ6189287.1 hypothetical protein N7519_004195 [Penicillium mononematosum]
MGLWLNVKNINQELKVAGELKAPYNRERLVTMPSWTSLSFPEPPALFLGSDAEEVIDSNLKLTWQLDAYLYYQNFRTRLYGPRTVGNMDIPVDIIFHRLRAHRSRETVSR